MDERSPEDCLVLELAKVSILRNARHMLIPCSRQNDGDAARTVPFVFSINLSLYMTNMPDR